MELITIDQCSSLVDDAMRLAGVIILVGLSFVTYALGYYKGRKDGRWEIITINRQARDRAERDI